MGWRRRFRSVGESFLQVLQAEIHSLLADFATSGRLFSRGLAWLLLAASLMFWSVGVVIAGLVALLSLWLPVWAAAGVVTILTSGGMALAGYLGLRVLRSIEPPNNTVRRHLDDHVTWWQGEVLDRSGRLSTGASRAQSRPANAFAGLGSTARSEGTPGDLHDTDEEPNP